MKNAWTTYDENQLKEVMSLSDDYMTFLSKGKTERKCVSLILEEAKKHGYKEKFVLEEYPLEGKRHYFTKRL